MRYKEMMRSTVSSKRRRTWPTAIPPDPAAWLREIGLAYLDAREAIPFGNLLGESFSEADLFHLAPQVLLKFRGLPASSKNLKRATDAALASYVANQSRSPATFADPRLSFSFCYLAAHYGLGLVDEEVVDKVMIYIEARLDELPQKVDQGTP